MNRFLFFISILFFSKIISAEDTGNIIIKSNVIKAKKAKSFDKKYSLVLPCHDYFKLFDFITPGLFESMKSTGHKKSYILNNNAFGKTYNKIIVEKNSIDDSQKSILTEIWMQPLGHDSNGFMYLDNFKIISRKNDYKISKELNIGKDIHSNFDRHCMYNVGDSIFYFTVADYHRKKKIDGVDTIIIDFDFYEWNANTNKNEFLFSSSTIVPDSMLVPELFESEGIYEKILDIYHWNWLEKTDNNKLLINFAFNGFLQIDLNTQKIDWYWGNNGHSFSTIKGIGDKSNPYYTHDINLIRSGPYKGYYSYFENGANGDSIIPFKPARARIFKINPIDKSIEIVFEKVYDIFCMAMGSIDVTDNYVLVNLGMNTPVGSIMNIIDESGKEAAVDYLRNYDHPHIYLYDLKGNEIANYTYPFGFYSYITWIKKK